MFKKSCRTLVSLSPTEEGLPGPNKKGEATSQNEYAKHPVRVSLPINSLFFQYSPL